MHASIFDIDKSDVGLTISKNQKPELEVELWCSKYISKPQDYHNAWQGKSIPITIRNRRCYCMVMFEGSSDDKCKERSEVFEVQALVYHNDAELVANATMFVLLMTSDQLCIQLRICKTISRFPSQPFLFSGDVEAFHVLRFTSSLRPVWGTFWVWDVKMDKDYDEVDEVNKQLDQMGYNIGIRLFDEFLAKSYVSRCVDFKETADVIAKLLYCFCCIEA
ncbi:hypothetical protein VNO77_33902 [Canavalia gladiata]|uniref:Uncharacterized protein n=1 Tax=Canavalia gladiata TaxID=3824 RepID=A0AAN9KFK2_CANGL